MNENCAEFDGNVFDLFRLGGRVAIVTGGAKTLGFHKARALDNASAFTERLDYPHRGEPPTPPGCRSGSILQ